jgi:crossover junction endodeoxyribonuclease RuvC
MSIFVGLDLGLTGAIAYIKSSGEVSVVDMPTIKVGKRNDYVVSSLVGCLVAGGPGPMKDMVVGMEALHAMPSRMCSGLGNYSLGRSSGLWEGILTALNIPFQKIPSQRWKKVLLDGLPKVKGSSIIVAKRLFPGVSLDRKKDHGRADALLIAEYLRRTYPDFLKSLD